MISQERRVSHVETVERGYPTNDPHDKGSGRFQQQGEKERKRMASEKFLFSCHPLKRREDWRVAQGETESGSQQASGISMTDGAISCRSATDWTTTGCNHFGSGTAHRKKARETGPMSEDDTLGGVRSAPITDSLSQSKT